MTLIPDNYDDLPAFVKEKNLLSRELYKVLQKDVNTPQIQAALQRGLACLIKPLAACSSESSTDVGPPLSYVSYSEATNRKVFIIPAGKHPFSLSCASHPRVVVADKVLGQGSNSLVYSIIDLKSGTKTCLRVDKNNSMSEIFNTKPALNRLFEYKNYHRVSTPHSTFMLLSNDSGTLVDPTQTQEISEGYLCFEIDFIPGLNFAQFIARKETLLMDCKALDSTPENRNRFLFTLEIFKQAAVELYRFHHELDLLHTDIKADNLMISPPYTIDNVKVSWIDFGNSIIDNLAITEQLGAVCAPEVCEQLELNELNELEEGETWIMDEDALEEDGLSKEIGEFLFEELFAIRPLPYSDKNDCFGLGFMMSQCLFLPEEIEQLKAHVRAQQASPDRYSTSDKLYNRDVLKFYEICNALKHSDPNLRMDLETAINEVEKLILNNNTDVKIRLVPASTFTPSFGSSRKRNPSRSSEQSSASSSPENINFDELFCQDRLYEDPNSLRKLSSSPSTKKYRRS